ncbi:MAG: MFS transporter [Lachnospiraceae bacterium]|nr:MFS transporter [Lachnospiraceae bacterium]
MQKERFPIRLILPYLIYYAGQALFNSYRNLYLKSIGLSTGKIGVLASVGIITALLFQPVLGIASDRAKMRSHVLIMIFLMGGLTALGFYVSEAYWVLLLANAVFYIFFQPIVALLDGFTLEMLETRKSRYSFGTIRTFGSVGYAVSMLVVGYFIGTKYRSMFWIYSLFMASSALSMAGLRSGRTDRAPREKRRGGELGIVKELLRRKTFLLVISMQVILMLAMTFYSQFYTLYFTEFAGGELVGLLVFVMAMSEVPFWPFADRFYKAFGVRKALALGMFLEGVRFIVMALTRNAWVAIGMNLISGFCLILVYGTVILYTDHTVPPEIRATGQSIYSIASTVFCAVIGGAVFGYVAEWAGIPKTFAAIAVILMAVGILMFLFARALDREPGIQKDAGKAG